jgi:hypothetical protein
MTVLEAIAFGFTLGLLVGAFLWTYLAVAEMERRRRDGRPL